MCLCVLEMVSEGGREGGGGESEGVEREGEGRVYLPIDYIPTDEMIGTQIMYSCCIFILQQISIDVHTYE